MSDANSSLVNRLSDIIPNPRINCRRLGLDKIDYRLMMHDIDAMCNVAFTDNGKIIKEKTDPLIVRYCELNKKYQFALNDAVMGFSSDDSSKSKLCRDMKYMAISRQIVDELSVYGYSDVEIADMLVKFLYGIKNGKNKMALWLCYGDIVYDNLSRNIKPKTKEIQCVDCGKWFSVSVKDNETCRCHDCYAEYRKAYYREKKREQRLKSKMSTAQN